MSGAGTSNRTARQDRVAEAAAAVARRWVRWYSGLVSTEAAERRRAEIESDLWEQRADARGRGVQQWAVAASLAWRVVGGAPDDLLWVRTQRLAMRGLQADRKATLVNSLGHFVLRWWWVVAATLLAAIYLWFGVDNLVGEYAPLPEAAAQCFTYLTVIVVGIVLRIKVPRLAGILICTGAVPALVVWWAPLVVLLGGLVVVGALIEVVRLSAPGALSRIGAVFGTLLLGSSSIILTLGFSPGSGPAAWVGLAAGIVAGAAGVALLIATRVTQRSSSDAPGLTPA